MKLDLIIPGLLTLPSATDALPVCRLLETWLARSKVSHAKHDYHAQLFSLVNLPDATSPAWLSALADNCERPHLLWRADPVHFQAQTDHAVLFDSHSLNIEQAEMAQLVAGFNAHFDEDGLQLHAVDSHRWYLYSQQPMNVKTTAITQAIGRNVRHFLPAGDDAMRWRNILNETQMLFHAHAVNQQREDAGVRSINSLWLWGEGRRNVDQIDYTATIYADEIVARGAARLANAPSKPVIEWMQQPGAGMLVLDDLMVAASYGDVAGWTEAFDALCQNKLPIILNALKTGVINRINLYPADGRCFTLCAKDVYKFWRLRKHLQHWMQYDS
jgi:hypothetical protein